jgi:hypothetical protein
VLAAAPLGDHPAALLAEQSPLRAARMIAIVLEMDRCGWCAVVVWSSLIPRSLCFRMRYVIVLDHRSGLAGGTFIALMRRGAPLPLAFLQAVGLKPNPSNRNASIPTWKSVLWLLASHGSGHVGSHLYFGAYSSGMCVPSPVHKQVDNLWTDLQIGGRVAVDVLRMFLLGESQECGPTFNEKLRQLRAA